MALGRIGGGGLGGVTSSIGNIFSGIGNPFGGGGTSKPSIPNLPELDLEEFKKRLPGVTEQLFGADFGGEQFQDLANRFQRLARQFEQERLNVAQDPRFQQFQEAQFNVFEQGAEQDRRDAAANLARSGIGVGSSNFINQLGGINQRLNTQRQALAGQLGLQELGREDQLRQQATQNLFGSLGAQASALGQAGSAEDLRLNALTAGLENYLAIPSLQVSQQAAQVAGTLPGERRPGLLSSILKGLF